MAKSKVKSKGKSSGRKTPAAGAKESAPKRKSAIAAAATSQKKERAGIREYFKGVYLEMKKVVWPTREELGSYTAVVLIACTFFGVIFWLVDTGFLAVLKSLLGITLR